MYLWVPILTIQPTLGWGNQSYIFPESHCNDVIMSVMASQITSLTIVYSTVSSGADQRKHQSSGPLAFVRGIHGWPVNSPHKWPENVDNVIMPPINNSLTRENQKKKRAKWSIILILGLLASLLWPLYCIVFYLVPVDESNCWFETDFHKLNFHRYCMKRVIYHELMGQFLYVQLFYGTNLKASLWGKYLSTCLCYDESLTTRTMAL